jgi:hypothetical protein
MTKMTTTEFVSPQPSAEARIPTTTKALLARTRTVTFQPSSGARAALAEVMKATGKSKSAVVNEALEVAGPHLSGAYLAKKAKLAADIVSALKESHDSREGG